MAGISSDGESAEAIFMRITGASKTAAAADGDAILDGFHVEVKKAGSDTLNQVRAVKYLVLVAYRPEGQIWWVIPPHEVVKAVAGKARGQHTENAFESATLTVRDFEHCKVSSRDLKKRVIAAAEEASKFVKLRDAMRKIRDDASVLASQSRTTVQKILKDYGL